MTKLIRQLDFLGSQIKEHGVHASSRRKPEVSLEAPTYVCRGSNFSSTPQGGIEIEAGDEDIVKSKGVKAFYINTAENIFINRT